MRIDEVGDVQLGRQRSPKNRSASYPTKYLRAANITERGLDVTDVLEMDFKPSERERYQLHPGDIILSEASGSASQVGKPAMWRGELPLCCFQNTVIRLRPKHADSKYLLWLFTHFYRNGIFSRVAAGVGINHLSAAKFKQLEIPVPSLPLQRRIVAELEKQFPRLDAGVAALRRTQANLKRYRAAVLKAACEGRLVPTEAELAKQQFSRRGSIPKNNNPLDFESGASLLDRILNERRQWFDAQQAEAITKKKYVEPAQPATAGLPSLPDGWTWGTWNQISNWVTYGFTRPMPHVDAGIPIITAKGVIKGRIDFEGAHLTPRDAYVDLSEKDRPQVGDILITKDGTIGRAAVVDTSREFCINQSVAVIWLRACPIERKFLLTVIESELTQKPIWAKARGVAIQHLSITDFAKMALPIPPLAEQTRIVAEVERRLSVVEELEAIVNANLQRATRLHRSVLLQAFSAQTFSSDR